MSITPLDSGLENCDRIRPLLLDDHINDVDSTQTALIQADRARDDVFEIRNLLRAELKKQDTAHSASSAPVSMQEDELQKATEAAHKAAEEAAVKLTILHRNLMTLLGYRYQDARMLPEALAGYEPEYVG